jgi:signal-transduction protein with cAMP-binding, CBS, and nucleotidyltransferase domain
MNNKRQRRPPQPGEFQDPLTNYEPPEYADDLERWLCESAIGQMQIRPFAQIGPEATVAEALKAMEAQSFFCLLVVEEDRLIGVFTERDVLNRVLDQYEKVKNKPVRELMTPDPLTVYETDPPAKALNLMAHGGFRHIPVLSVDDRPIGVVGPMRTTQALREHIL